jgi:hypothetical protein
VIPNLCMICATTNRVVPIWPLNSKINWWTTWVLVEFLELYCPEISGVVAGSRRISNLKSAISGWLFFLIN